MMMLACEKLDSGNLSTGGNSCTDGFYIDIPTPSTRSVSPLSSVSPGKDRSYGFFQSIYRKISLKSSEELNSVTGDDDSRSSSVDSCSSISDHQQQHQQQQGQQQQPQQSKRRASAGVKMMNISNLELNSASTDSVDHCGQRSAEKELRPSRRSSVRKLLENLSLAAPIRSRSLSCSSTSVNLLSQRSSALKQHRTESKASLYSTNSAQHESSASKPPQKKILRRPVSYTYLRGISGLPTQRVPRSSICCNYYGR